MATASNDIDTIRRQMAQIRRELHEDVRDVVASAEAATDWKHYVRMYPWACLGAAVAVGYFVVPKRSESIPDRLASQADLTNVRDLVEGTKKKREEKKRSGLVGAAFGMLVPLVVRAGQNYAMHYFENWLAQQQQAMGGLGGGPFAATGGSPSPSVSHPGTPGGPSRPPGGPPQPPRGPGRPPDGPTRPPGGPIR